MVASGHASASHSSSTGKDEYEAMTSSVGRASPTYVARVLLIAGDDCCISVEAAQSSVAVVVVPLVDRPQRRDQQHRYACNSELYKRQRQHFDQVDSRGLSDSTYMNVFDFEAL